MTNKSPSLFVTNQISVFLTIANRRWLSFIGSRPVGCSMIGGCSGMIMWEALERWQECRWIISGIKSILISRRFSSWPHVASWQGRKFFIPLEAGCRSDKLNSMEQIFCRHLPKYPAVTKRSDFGYIGHNFLVRVSEFIEKLSYIGFRINLMNITVQSDPISFKGLSDLDPEM